MAFVTPPDGTNKARPRAPRPYTNFLFYVGRDFLGHPVHIRVETWPIEQEFPEIGSMVVSGGTRYKIDSIVVAEWERRAYATIIPRSAAERRPSTVLEEGSKSPFTQR
jgi:hypothetical protein